MRLRPEALSSDGFIIDQRKTDNIPFGAVNSDRNGCGWIACYNLLKALGRDPDPEAIVRRLERTLQFRGYLGLHLFSLVWELRRNQHIPLDYAIRFFHAQQNSEHASAGIVLYFTGKRNHFVAFRWEGNGRLRFFGATPGRSGEIISMADFYRLHVKGPMALTITVR